MTSTDASNQRRDARPQSDADATLAVKGEPPGRTAETGEDTHLQIEEATTAALTDAMFAAFVLVADVGSGLTAKDVDSFHAWVRRRSTKASTVLRPVIKQLGPSFPALWKRHVAGGQRPSAAMIVATFQRFRHSASTEDSEALAVELAGLLDRYAPRQPSAVPGTAGQALIAKRREARAALEASLNEVTADPISEQASAAPAAVAKPTAPSQRRDQRSSAGGQDADAPPNQLLLPAWPRSSRYLRCVAVIDETHDVKTFVFEGRDPQLFAYQPGQFITLELPIADGRKLRRSYTLSSSPSRPHRVSITVKQVPDGRGSGWLHRQLGPGVELKVSGPHGEFTCGTQAPYPKLLLLAAGSGITPIASMLRWLADTTSGADLVLINSVRTPNDVIFDAELRYLASRLASVSRIAIVPSRVHPGQHWVGPTGRFSEQLLEALAPDWRERQVFTCGPDAYMAHVREILLTKGLPPQQYHEERFGAASADAAERDYTAVISSRPGSQAAIRSTLHTPTMEPSRRPEPNANTQASAPAGASPGSAPERLVTPARPSASAPALIRFSASAMQFEAEPGENLLELAEQQGIEVPSSCRAGNCGTCKVKKLSGDVSMDEQDALSDDEIAEGWILCCVSETQPGRLELDA